MRLLLDTHAFLWWILDSPKVSEPARRAVADPVAEVLLSSVTAWEIAVKHAAGRLPLPEDPRELVPREAEASGFQVLPLHLGHALGLLELPDHHRDPFDRMLVAQARAEGLAIVSGDPRIARYNVEVVW